MTQDPNQPSGSPEDHYAAEGYDAASAQDDDGLGGQTLDQSAPSVAAPQNRMVMMVLLIVFVIIMLVVMLMGGDDEDAAENAELNKESASIAPPVHS